MGGWVVFPRQGALGKNFYRQVRDRRESVQGKKTEETQWVLWEGRERWGEVMGPVGQRAGGKTPTGWIEGQYETRGTCGSRMSQAPLLDPPSAGPLESLGS